MTTDVLLNELKGYYDFDWTPEGDIPTTNSFDTAILMTIFEEVRANSSEIVSAHKRRGWIGNETQETEQGSKFWLFEQERITGTMLSELGSIIRGAFQFFIDDGLSEDVVVGQPFLRQGSIIVEVSMVRDGNTTSNFYDIWNNTLL